MSDRGDSLVYYIDVILAIQSSDRLAWLVLANWVWSEVEAAFSFRATGVDGAGDVWVMGVEEAAMPAASFANAFWNLRPQLSRGSDLIRLNLSFG